MVEVPLVNQTWWGTKLSAKEAKVQQHYVEAHLAVGKIIWAVDTFEFYVTKLDDKGAEGYFISEGHHDTINRRKSRLEWVTIYLAAASAPDLEGGIETVDELFKMDASLAGKREAEAERRWTKQAIAYVTGKSNKKPV